MQSFLLGKRARSVASLILIGMFGDASLSGQDVPKYSYGAARPLEIDRGTSALWQDLQKLKTRASLILIVAHPDDEDGPMLAYESRDCGVDTSLLTLNRGEGGQNLMSNDLWDRLGEVRTQELLAAGQAYGVHQYFTRVADYGFSKTLEEAMKQWGHDRVLYDVVRVVRMTRPMVVTAVFVGGVSDGHGHHQTSGEMAQEVFNAAADPKIFPDQIAAGLLPWAPLKVYARAPFARATAQGLFDYATGHYSPVRFRDYVHNTFIEGLPSTTVAIPEGDNNPLFGDSPIAVARVGLGNQKSQNGGTAVPLPRAATSQYHLYASRVTDTLPTHEDSFFEGIDTTLSGIASYAPAAQQAAWQDRLKAIEASVEQAAASFTATSPSKSAPALAKGLSQTVALIADLRASPLPADAKYNMEHELDIKRDQFNQALNDALSLSLVATVGGGGGRGGSGGPGGPAAAPGAAATPALPAEAEGPGRDAGFQSVVPGDAFRVAVHIADEGSEPIEVVESKLVSHAGDGWSFTPSTPSTGALAAGETRDQIVAITVPAGAELTKPFFSRKTVEQSYYDILDPRYLNLPTTPYPLSAEVTYRYGGAEAHLSGVVQTSHRYVGPGPVLEPLLVAPAISLTVSPEAGIVPVGNATLHLQVTVHSSVKGAASGSVKLDLPAGWASDPVSAPFATEAYNDERIVNFTITPKAVQQKPYTITAVAESGGKTFQEGFEMAGYVGLRPYPFYRPSTYQTTGVNLKIAPGLKVAYIMGTGDDVPQSLEDIGIHVTMLSAQDVSTADLASYDAIVLGIRTYSARPELARANARLLNYAKAGGVVIVQYQSTDFNGNFAPYPFTLGGNGVPVVEEDSKVTILAPQDPVLNWPNHIGAADFEGWIEERGHGFPQSWGPQFVPLTEMHDLDQEPQNGGLLYAHYGKGAYVYMAYAFFRQMPEGVPGSFRIMANLLSIAKNPEFKSAAAPAK
jgi:LmbE family N-acetylglucosaminyl deacetylase